MRILKTLPAMFCLLAVITLSFSCDKDVSVSPPDPPVHTGYLFINSNPPGTSIYLNGKNTGRHTPDSLSWMEGAEYRITLKYPLYMDTTFSVSIEEDKKKEVFIDYYSNPLMYGKISCETTPDNAIIFLDGLNTGKLTPATLEGLIPGTHRIKYRKTGCRDDSLQAVVESNKVKYTYVQLIDTTEWVTYNSKNSGLPVDRLTQLLFDKNEVMWLGTLGEGVVRYDGLSWKSFNTTTSPIPNNYVTVLTFVNQTNLWIGTKDGLAVMSGNSWSVYKKENSILPDNYITSICQDKSGAVWVGTMQGLVRIQGSNWQLFNKSNSPLASNLIQGLAASPDGRVWIGVGLFGLMTFDGTKWNSHTKEKYGLPGHDITALAVGQTSGQVWAGFSRNIPQGEDEGGLAVQENNSWRTNYTALPSRYITNIIIQNDVVWVCTDRGLLKFSDTGHWAVWNTGSTKLPSNYITCAREDSRGNVWITTANSGLVKRKRN